MLSSVPLTGEISSADESALSSNRSLERPISKAITRIETIMRKIISLITSILTLTLYSFSSFAAGDSENIKKLSGFKPTGTKAGIVIPQDTKFAANVKKNILPNINLPAGFSISVFAVVPDARHMAVPRNKTTVWIGTRKDKVWQATDRDMDDIADTVEQFAPTVKFDAICTSLFIDNCPSIVTLSPTDKVDASVVANATDNLLSIVTSSPTDKVDASVVVKATESLSLICVSPATDKVDANIAPEPTDNVSCKVDVPTTSKLEFK